MSIKAWTLSGLLLLACPISWANSAATAPKQVETLPDPTVSTTEKLRARFIEPMANKQASSSEDIKDPTAMNENFRAALSKTKPSSKTATNSPATATPSLPDIKLLAAVCEHHPEKNHAMLSVNGKSEMIGVGDKITSLVSNHLIEIEVLEIQKNHVRLRLQPNNETLILR